MTTDHSTRAVWDWKGSRAAEDRLREKRSTRARGFVFLAVGGSAGALLFRFMSERLAYSTWAVTLLLAFTAIIGPQPLFHRIDRGVRLAARTLGRALNLVLLIPIFVFFLFPRSILLRLRRENPLNLGYDASVPTYWKTSSDEKRSETFYRKAY